MATYRIKTPDGHEFDIDGPDDATDDQLSGAAQEYLKSALPEQVFGPANVVRPKPTSFLQGVAEGAAKPLNNAARAIESGLGAIGLGDAVASASSALGLDATVADAQAAQAANVAASPNQGSDFGRFVGEVAGTLPAAALPGGLAVQGAASGAMLTDADTPGGVALDAGIGAATSVLGGAAVRGIGGLVAPNVDPSARLLLNEGVRLTPGQIVGQSGNAGANVGASQNVGRGVKRIEDTLSNFPVIGTAIRGARETADRDLNRAAINRALRPIGENLPRNQEVGHGAIDYTYQRLRAAYQDVLPRLNGTLDRTFDTRVRAIRQRAQLPPEYDAMLDQAQNELGNAFTRAGPNGAYSGRTLRDTSERLEDLAAGWRRNDDPYIRRVGDAAEQMRQQLHALARRQNPGDARRLRDVDRGYASYVRVEQAAKNMDDGIFTSQGYKAATRNADRSVRRGATARGQALDQDLSAAAAQVMPSRVGEGGSNAANSLAMLGALAAGALGGKPAAVGGLAGLGLAGSLYTQPGLAASRYILGRQAGRTSQGIRALLEQGARAAPVIAPPLVQGGGN